MKQGDVLSPTLFNAGLEQACKTGSYAYNHTAYIFVPQKTYNFFVMQRMCYDVMICEVVEGAGGHIGVASCATHTCSAAIEHSHFQKKCLQFASWNALYTLTFVMIFLIFLGILWGNDKHKYLGRTACGNWRRRGFVQLQRKIRTGRTTFQNYRQILTNKHIALELTVETI